MTLGYINILLHKLQQFSAKYIYPQRTVVIAVILCSYIRLTFLLL